MRLGVIFPLYFFSLLSFAQETKYEKIWETLPAFQAPVALAYDSQKTIYYVANENKSVLDPGYSYSNRKDGFISKISSTGEIIQLKWVEGLENPSDLFVKGNQLYVTDEDNFIIIDISRQKIIKTINTSDFVNEENSKITVERIDSHSSGSLGPPPERSNLSSVTVLPNGRVFVLDGGYKAIYELVNDELKTFVKNHSFIDGRKIIYSENTNSLFIMKSDGVYALSLQDNTLGKRIDIYKAFPAQGISRINAGKYFIFNSFNKIFSLENNEIIEVLSIGEPCKCTTDIESLNEGNIVTVLISNLNKLISFKIR